MSIFNDILHCNLGKKTSPLFLYRLWIEQIERSEVGMKLSEL